MPKFKSILVIGAAGYKGSVLVPKLLAAGYKVKALDLMLYGSDGLPPPSDALEIIKCDIRNTAQLGEAATGCDAVIHLACISNDPSFELNAELSKTINFDCFEDGVLAIKSAGVRRFIYISSSSVYGVSDAPKVMEDHPLLPLTDYSKYKGLTEQLLLKHQSKDFVCTIMRPATVCGYSPRMRMDLSVNILTNLAVNKRKITVFGGTQLRPNIHIDDVTELYVKMLEYPDELIAGEVFNAGFQNRSISDIAEIVKSVVETEMPELAPIEVETTTTDDNRSYRVNSDKIESKLGWRPKHTIEDAVRDICSAFKSGKLPNSLTEPNYFNVKKINLLGLK